MYDQDLQDRENFFHNLDPIISPAPQVKSQPPKIALANSANVSNKAGHKFSRVQLSLFSLAAVCLIIGGFLSYTGLKSIIVSKLSASGLMVFVDNTAKGSGSSGINNISTAKISPSTLASYTVAPNLPRYLLIPKLNVDARVLSVGLDSNGAVGTPQDIYDTAWYNHSVQPGQVGAMLIDGHVSGWSAKGVFYNLKTLQTGDTIQIQRGDNAVLTYRVVRSQIYPYNNVDMKAAMEPVVSDKPGLNLITCTGYVLRGTSEYSQRLIVFTEQV